MTDEEELMNDPETLAMTFATAVATSAGNSLVDWVKRRFNSDAAEAAHTLAADPDNDSSKNILANILRKELEGSPSLVDELHSLLDQSGVDYARQTANSSGGSTIIQIQGNNNLV